MIEIKDMFAHGVHYGHKSCFSNPQMAEFVFAQKNDLQIIDITKTAMMFGEALNFADQLVRSGGRIVVVGTKQAARDLVNEYGQGMDMPYVDQRWLGGTLTNFKTVRASVARLDQLDKRFEAGKLEGLTKKERLILMRERAKLTVSLGGIKEMEALPEALFVIDVAQERIAIKEANKLGIPVIGVVDTNNSVEGVDYVIPGNDDAISAIQYYLECLSAVVKSARSDYLKEQERLEKKNKPVVRKAVTASKSEEQVEEKEVEAEESAPKKKVVKRVVKKNDATEAPKEEPKKVVKKVVTKKVKAKESGEEEKKTAKKPAAKKVSEVKTKSSTKKEAKSDGKKAPAKKAVAKKAVAKEDDAKPAKKAATKKPSTTKSAKKDTKE